MTGAQLKRYQVDVRATLPRPLTNIEVDEVRGRVDGLIGHSDGTVAGEPVTPPSVSLSMFIHTTQSIDRAIDAVRAMLVPALYPWMPDEHYHITSVHTELREPEDLSFEPFDEDGDEPLPPAPLIIVGSYHYADRWAAEHGYSPDQWVLLDSGHVTSRHQIGAPYVDAGGLDITQRAAAQRGLDQIAARPYTGEE